MALHITEEKKRAVEFETYTEEFDVYRLEELDDEAQEKAIEDYRAEHYDEEYPWWSEVRDTIDAIGEYLGMQTDWEMSQCSCSYVEFKHDDFEDVAAGVRSYTWIYNNWIIPLYESKTYRKGYSSNGKAHGKARKSHVYEQIKGCPFTGYCLDDVFYIAFKKFRKEIQEGSELSVDDFLTMVEEKLCKDVMDDWEYMDSDEHISEMLADTWFTEDGEVYEV